MTVAKPTEIVYPELSRQLMGIAFDIHNGLGPGFLESIYHKAFIQELATAGIPFETEKAYDVLYKGQIMGVHRLDLLVDNKIIVELKAVAALNDVFKQQVFSYLRATNLRLGLLINFGAKSVEAIRVLNKFAA